MADDTAMLMGQGQGLAWPSVEVAGSCFRVWTPRFATQGLPATPSHRHITVAWLRLLRDEPGKP
jgi:hypothetical protein